MSSYIWPDSLPYWEPCSIDDIADDLFRGYTPVQYAMRDISEALDVHRTDFLDRMSAEFWKERGVRRDEQVFDCKTQSLAQI